MVALEQHNDLGRRVGVFVPAVEVEAHAACGWRLLDDLAGMSGAGDMVLMAPPPQFIEGDAA